MISAQIHRPATACRQARYPGPAAGLFSSAPGGLVPPELEIMESGKLPRTPSPPAQGRWRRCWLTMLSFLLLAPLLPAAAQEANPPTYFGSTTRSENALIGILYDFKQDQKRKPKKEEFLELMGKFVREGWDEGILNEFYRATRPLYTTQVFVPHMNADEAPRSFGVQDIMQPRNWVVHYKGQVSPPRAGTFRFVGLSDDLLAVAVNGKTALIAEHPGSRLKKHGWRDAPRDGIETPSGPAISGDWFTVKDGQILDLDIIVGERPGGQFGAWLMIEEQGATYEKDVAGKPVIPVFQLTDQPIPGDRTPRARKSRPDELWKGNQ